ncbi:hypothetical protein [Pseudoduganella sp. OTU4001]|uniref:hypothetical protein n=1 Tax=Pseudoduganella sp. OTU4001 TaxID=3043854 RepID=UPI00313ACFE8
MRLVLAIAAIAAIVIALWGDGGTRSVPAAVAAFKPAASPVRAGAATPAAGATAAAAAAETAASIHSVEVQVRQARLSGRGENEAHRLRAAQLPAAQAIELAAMEAAESEWQRRVKALRSACETRASDCAGERSRRFTAEELPLLGSYEAPTLRQ